MATQYFRVTAYNSAEDISAIFDSNGLYEKLWQFSSFLLSKGFQVLEVSTDEKFLDINISKTELVPDKLILRAHSKGRPESPTYSYNGVFYQAVKVGEKIYIPDRNIIKST